MMVLDTPIRINAAPAPIKIGVVTDRSGALASYGEMEVNGLNLGIEYATNGTFNVLGRPIQIIVEDDVGNPTTAVSKATKLILDDGVDFLQGSASSACASAIQTVANQYGVIFMVAPAADASITGTGFNNYTFRTASNTWQDAFTGGPFAVAYIGKTFAFLAPDYSWGYSTVYTWSYAIEKAGGTVIHTEYAPQSTVNFAPYLNRIIAAHPDVLIPVWSGSGALYLFPAMSDLGIYDKMNVTSGIGDLFSLQLLGVAMNFTGMTKYAYMLPNNTVNDWLVNTWRARYDNNTLPVKTSLTLPVPDLFVAGAFAAGQAIVYAIEKAGNTETDGLITALEGLSFTSPKGYMYIRPEDHQALQSMYIAQVYNDTTSWITDYPAYHNGFINLRLIAEIPPELTAPPIRGDVIPPTISDVENVPSIPTTVDDVNVSAIITDNLVGVKNATLYYSINGSVNWTGVPMMLVQSTKYLASIPKQTNGTVVEYYINATDIALNTASSNTTTYTVIGDFVPPTISSVERVPGIPTTVDDVNVSATITDNLVGVKNASLYYSTDGGLNWTGVPMELVGSAEYTATIPKQANGTVVEYYINATDLALNVASSNIATYTVLALPKYNLTISVQPPGEGTTDPPVGVRSYTEGENVTVTITVAGGYEFDYWELDGSRFNGTTITVTMDANHTLTAYVKTAGIPIEIIAVGIVVGIAIIGTAIFILRRKRLGATHIRKTQ
jgi:branched-chain amino acid transport system substrate-binding protein